MRSRVQYGVMAMILALAILVQPMALVSRQRVATAERGARELSFWSQSATGANDVFMPVIMTPPGPPAFVINSPGEGWAISGMIFFAAQVTDARTVTSVTFRAGSTELGTDNTSEDGYRVFLDANTFPAGPLQLTATATGPSGETSKSIMVNVVPNPPLSGTIGANGGVLASEIGSVITFPPAAVSDGTFVSVTEISQEDVTAETGIEWEDIGVTFLGAQDIQTSATIDKPLTVASAGFGNRVQPGQAVVNYRIIPDADGDGIDEIVVINTATVAPNDDVISDPIPQVQVNSVTVTSFADSLRFQNNYSGLAGMPGSIIEVEVNGFNLLSASSNLAIWISEVDGQKFEMPSVILPEPSNLSNQSLIGIVPPLVEGPATLTLKNLTTGYASEPISFLILPSPPLTQPAEEIIEHFLADTLAAFNDLSASSHVPEELAQKSIDDLMQAQSEFQVLISGTITPELEQALELLALMIQNSGIEYPSSLLRLSETPTNLDLNVGYGIGMVGALGLTARSLGTLAGIAGLTTLGAWLGLVAGVAGLAFLACLALGDGTCFPPPPAGTGGPGMTGMGAAPPPGGNGGGSAGGGGGSRFSSSANNFFVDEPGRYTIQIYSGGVRMPFTGLTDAGGYFFVPFIPAGEPFTAIAIDTVTGDTRSFDGIGPETDDSVYMFFDFFNEDEQPVSISWDGGGDGVSWEDPLNWDIDNIPTGSDRVLIDVPGNITVTHSTGNTSIISLQSEEVLNIAGGSLTVQATSVVNNNFMMADRTNLTASGGGASFTVNGLGNIDGANLFALNGGVISMPQITDYNGYTGASNTIWRATGTGSTLNFPGIAMLTGNTFPNAGLHVEALGGGVINLSGLEDIDAGHVTVTADGTNSEIDLSTLTSFVRTGTGGSTLRPINGGSILIDSLINLDRVGLVLDGTGTMSTGQIITFTGGTATVDGIAPDFSGMAMVDGSGFIVANGGDISLPQITDYNGYTGASNTVWRATGTGSTLNFPGITTLTGNTFANAALVVEALDGGTINLTNLVDIDAGHTQLSADGLGSDLDLSALATFVDTGTGGSSIIASDNANILLNSGTTTVQEVAVAFNSGGSLSVGTLVLNQNSSLSGSGSLNANVINGGAVRPGTSPGIISIGESYTQTVNGSLNIEIGGLIAVTEFDLLTVTDTSSIDGVLNISLINSYEPNLGDTFVILTANAISGIFATVNGTSIGNGKQFQVNYGANSVTLEVVPE